jgi:hypothetical protein
VLVDHQLAASSRNSGLNVFLDFVMLSPVFSKGDNITQYQVAKFTIPLQPRIRQIITDQSTDQSVRQLMRIYATISSVEMLRDLSLYQKAAYFISIYNKL